MTPAELKERFPNIRTQFINPTIPIRYFDWIAWYDGLEEKFHANGQTELEAIENLLHT